MEQETDLSHARAIRRERLLEWRQVSTTRPVLKVFGGFAAAGGVVGALNSPEAAFGGAVAGLLLGMALVVFWLQFPIRRRVEEEVVAACREDAKRALLAFARRPLAHADLGVNNDPDSARLVGSAIGWDGESLYVADRGWLVELPWEFVRSWRCEVTGWDATVILGKATPSARVDAALHSIGNSAQAYSTSGLFVTVADVEHPVLQFGTRDQAVLRRWHEALTQIREGRQPWPLPAREERAA